MALSQQVSDSLKEAQKHLRDALAFAARNEKPYVNVCIANMISDVDRIIFFDNILDNVESKKENNKRGFFNE